MRFIVGFSLLWISLASCDELAKDELRNGADDVTLISDKVYVAAQSGSSFISLASLVRTKVPVKFAVNELPRYGKLNNHENGLLEYSPEIISLKGDKFSFSILGSDNRLIKKQEVDIISVGRKKDIPCSAILAFTDNFINVGLSGEITLDVLANDWICNDLLNDLQLTIVDGPVHGGSVQITSDNKFRYTIPSADFGKFDKLIYSVQSKSNPSIQSSGVAYINFDNNCFFSPGGGSFTMPLSEASSLPFTPLYQAILCGYSIMDVTVQIIRQPKFGTVNIDDQKLFTYNPANLNKESYSDLFVFEICLPNGQCKKSTVAISLTSSSNCINKAVDDVAATWGELPVKTGFNVVSNDCGKNNIVSMRIVTPPVYGSASVFVSGETPHQINYSRTDYHDDELTYEICFNGGSCSTAKLYIIHY